LIKITRTVLAFNSILFSTDRRADMTLAELPLEVDGKFNIDRISAIVASGTGTEKSAMTSSRRGMHINQIKVTIEPLLVRLYKRLYAQRIKIGLHNPGFFILVGIENYLRLIYYRLTF
jgi:hypothetical protein